jgi:hypothetical protein
MMHTGIVVLLAVTKHKELVHWVFEQRSRYASGKLSEERRKKLDEIGFIFNVPEAAWLEQYHKLRSFFQQYGHIDVPDTYDKGLVSWIRNQRMRYRARPRLTSGCR